MSGYSGTMHAGAYHNGAYHNGYYHNGNYYHNHYYPYFFGSIYFGNPFWYNYAPGYADYGYGYANGYASSYPYEAPPIMTTPPSQSLPPEQSGPPNGSAQIDVVLPTVDAKVYIDGAPMASGSGMQRSFISPPLEQGYSYSYRLTAEWTTPDGQPMRIERVVPVAPGRLSIMDFTRVNPNQAMPPNQAAPPAPKMPLAPR